MSSSDSPSPLSGDLPVLSDDIVMVSLPDTQDDGKGTAVADVFHTPPEESSLPSSDLDICPVNHAVDANAGTQGFVDFCDAPESLDLGKDSQLEFSEVQAECSRGVGGDDLGENGKRQVHEVEDFEKEHSDLGEYPVKKSKLYDYDLGVEKVEQCVEKCKGKLVSESDGVVQSSDKVACVAEVNKSSSEKHGKSDERMGVLPPSVNGRVENVAGEGSSKGKMNVFDVLRALATMENDEDGFLDHPNLLDFVRLRGITFTRLRCHSKNYNPYCKERKN